MRCTYCFSPASLISGASYGLPETDSEYFCEFQCGLPMNSPGEACRERFLVLMGEGFRAEAEHAIEP